MKIQIRMAVSLAVALLLAECAPEKPVYREVVRKVKLAYPSQDSETTARLFPGIVREASEVNLAFRVAGPIGRIYVREGDYVRQGAPVAQIDPRDYEIQTGVYEAQYKQVKAEFDRLTELKSRNSVADNDYEKAVAGEKMLRMQLQNARDQLNDTRLYAPFSGYIQSVKYEEGELVNTGMTLATMIDISSYQVVVELPMAVFARKAYFTGFSCRQPLLPGREYPLTLIGYQMKANNSQLYRTTFRLDPGENPELAPGMTVEVRIEYRNGLESPLKIPVTALFHEEGKTWVWRYDSASSTVIRQEVRIGEPAGEGMVTLLGGLTAGDEFVVSGVDALRDGWSVRRLEKVSTTNVGGLM